MISFFTKYWLDIFFLFCGVMIGVGIAYIPIISIGVILYFVSLVVFMNLNRLKKIIPFIFWLMIFQDLLSRNIGIISENIGAYIGYTDEFFLLIAFPVVIINRLRRKKGLPILNYFSRIYLTKKLQIQRRSSKNNYDYPYIVLALVLLLGFISSINNKVPWNISVLGAFLMIKGILLFIIFKEIEFRKEDILRLIKTIKYIAFIILIFAFIDFVIPQTLRGIFNIAQGKLGGRWGIHYIQSLFIHPAKYGWFMVFVGLLYLAEFVVGKKKKSGIITIFYFIASLFSLRYKVILSIFTCGLFSSFHMSKKIRLQIYIPVVLTFIISVFLFTDLYISLVDVFYEKTLGTGYMHNARKALYFFSILIGIDNFPLGVGFGRFGGWISRQHYSPVYYEYGIDKIWGLSPDYNHYLNDTYWPYILGELGFIGLFVMLSLFGYFLYQLYRGFKRINDQITKSFLLFSILVILQSLVISLADSVYNTVPQFIFIFSIAGMGLSILRNHNRNRKIGE